MGLIKGWWIGLVLLAGVVVAGRGGAQGVEAWPGREWGRKRPAEVGLDEGKLVELSNVVGGRGCVVRQGFLVYEWGEVGKSSDVASAMKPVISTLLMIAIQEGRVRGVDDPVAEVEPGLRGLNGGKDGGITWRHLASQTSGYGLAEGPGEAWGYNDFALALYYDTLMGKVFREEGTSVLRTRLGEVLGFQDPYTFEAFGKKDRPGRLAVSVRDFARFGLMMMRRGRWKDRVVVREELVKVMLGSVVPKELPRTSGKEAAMLGGQRSIGGTRNITPKGPGQYSFNWWVNAEDREGRALFPELPAGTFVASGHGGRREMYVIPEWDLIVVWNEAKVKAGEGPGVAGAAKLMREAVR